MTPRNYPVPLIGFLRAATPVANWESPYAEGQEIEVRDVRLL
jgi:hypothetical protein